MFPPLLSSWAQFHSQCFYLLSLTALGHREWRLHMLWLLGMRLCRTGSWTQWTLWVPSKPAYSVIHHMLSVLLFPPHTLPLLQLGIHPHEAVLQDLQHGSLPQVTFLHKIFQSGPLPQGEVLRNTLLLCESCTGSQVSQGTCSILSSSVHRATTSSRHSRPFCLPGHTVDSYLICLKNNKLE